MGTVPVWGGYGHIFIPTGSILTLPVRLWVGYGYNPYTSGYIHTLPIYNGIWTYSVDLLDMTMRL